MKLKLYHHFLKYQQIYLLLLLFIILGLPLLLNQIQDKPFLMGAESYYHLQSAQEVNANNFYYLGLHYLENNFYNFGFVLIPIFLAFASLIIFFQIAKKIKLSQKFTFFLSLFIIISPSFIFTHLTLSASSLFLFLILSASYLLLQKKSTIPLPRHHPFHLRYFH